MNTYLALLRGINVGGHTVKMVDLRIYFEELGFQSVTTHIQTGNVYFVAPEADPEALAATIERHLSERLGFAVATIIRTQSQMEAAVKRCPYSEEEKSGSYRLYVGFTASRPEAEARERLLARQTEFEHFYLGDEAVYMAVRQDSPEAYVTTPVEKILAVKMTVRNWGVTQKLASLFGS